MTSRECTAVEASCVTRSSARGRCNQRSRISAARGSVTARSRKPRSISASDGGSLSLRVARPVIRMRRDSTLRRGYPGWQAVGGEARLGMGLPLSSGVVVLVQRLPVGCVVVPPRRAQERAAIDAEVVERDRYVGVAKRRIVREDGKLHERLGGRERCGE